MTKKEIPKAKKITISIPMDLYERLQEVKNKFNISGLCQNTIQHEIYRQELMEGRIKGATEMDNIVERLKLEKDKYVERYIDQGCVDGYNDAKKLSYEEIMEIVNGFESINKTEVYLRLLKDQIKDLKENDDSIDENKYLEGWVEGVEDFWEEIKDRI